MFGALAAALEVVDIGIVGGACLAPALEAARGDRALDLLALHGGGRGGGGLLLDAECKRGRSGMAGGAWLGECGRGGGRVAIVGRAAVAVGHGGGEMVAQGLAQTVLVESGLGDDEQTGFMGVKVTHRGVVVEIGVSAVLNGNMAMAVLHGWVARPSLSCSQTQVARPHRLTFGPCKIEPLQEPIGSIQRTKDLVRFGSFHLNPYITNISYVLIYIYSINYTGTYSQQSSPSSSYSPSASSSWQSSRFISSLAPSVDRRSDSACTAPW